MADKTENRPEAIKISGVKKMYKLGQIGGGSLQADLQSWWARKRGKEDPNTKIGEDQRSNGLTFMALNGIDLTIYQGEAVGIIGSNGAGKSTLLKLLSKVTAPTKGEIDIYGRIASMLEVGTGFNGELTGRENVYMNGAILGMTKEEIDAKMEQIIEFSEVREFIDTPVKRYSSGMFVKLAFSVAAHLDSEIMIMDEVLAVGDMAFQKKCLTRMREAAKQEGRTVLYVSHNMNTIRQLCDRCVLLDKGRVVFDGNVESAINMYMGTENWSKLKTYYDFSKIKRRYHFGQDVMIKCISLLKKETADYEINEPIDLQFVLKSRLKIEDMKIIVRIKDNNNAIRIAASLSESFKIIEGDNQHFRFRLITEGLVEDYYCLSAEIIKYDQSGNYLSYDNPDAIIPFRLINKGNDSVKWSTKYWGNIQLQEMKRF